jgi:rhodanese-related sulfurtransferase
MRTIAITLLIAVAFVSTAFCSTPLEGEKYSLITLREARDLQGKAGVFFMDVNEQEVYERYHIAGATPVTSEDLRRFLPQDKQSTIIFYCAERRCYASHAAAREAIQLGYTRVLVMPEGIFGWVSAGLPTEKGAVPKTGTTNQN